MRWWVGLGLAGWLGSSLLAGLPNLPATPPAPVELAKLSRTLNLLRSATPENRRPVRILFFGQSITQQIWWLEVASRLRSAYPHADLDIRNHAIAGFNAGRLSGVVEHHVAAYLPDLVILHDYGSEAEMDRLVGRIRRRTTADILLQTDHLQLGQEWEPIDPRLITSNQFWPYRNYVSLPRVAHAHDACLADIRLRWREYLLQHSLKAEDLLRDWTHLNDAGNTLMAGLIWRFLRPSADLPATDPDDGARVRRVEINRGSWAGGSLRLAFTGSTVEVVTDQEAPEVMVLLDGRPPGEAAVLHQHSAITRSHSSHGWPTLLEVESDVTPRIESWELTVTEVFAGSQGYRFRVEGAITGPDGEGRSDRDFRSNSGQVVIGKDAHVLPFAAQQSGVPIPVGFKARWQGLFNGTNSFRPTAPAYRGQHPTTVLFRGLADQPHVLELRQPSTRARGIRWLRVYSPGGRAEAAVMASPSAVPKLELFGATTHGMWSLRWTTNVPGLWPQRATAIADAAGWEPVPGTASVEEGEFSLEIPEMEGWQFFRLASQPAADFQRPSPEARQLGRGTP